MAKIGKAGACVALAAVLLVATGAHAASHAAKCEAAKLKVAGTYTLCRLKVQAKEVKTGMVGRGDFAKCETTFTDKWTAAETKGGGSCPTGGDAGRVQSLVDQLAMTAGFTLAGPEFVDNGDGTISDIYTGLMWEKKTSGECVFTPVPGFPIACTTDNDCVNNGGGGACTCGADPHCVLATYTWSTGTDMPDGTAFTEFLGQLNNCVSDGTTISGGFAGHCDWRLPSIDELNGILDLHQPGCPGQGLCIDPTFEPVAVNSSNSSSPSHWYWSSTAVPLNLDSAFGVGFDLFSGTGPKTLPNWVRAVRSAN